MATVLWDDYLSSWSDDKPSLFNKRNLRARITNERKAKRLFLRRGNVDVRITNVTARGTATSTRFDDEETLSGAVEEGFQNDEKLKIISIYSEDSISPLGIKSDLMINILKTFHVHPDFLRVLLSFGEAMHVAEASTSNSTVSSSNDGKSTYISYQLNYVEENNRSTGNPWSWRHTGIYHHHLSGTSQTEGMKQDLIIILHPNPDSILETRILEWLDIDPSKSSDTANGVSMEDNDAFLLHPLALDSFVDNYRWYFRQNIGAKFNYENNQAMTTKPERADAVESFDRVERLRHLADSVLQANACCKSNLDIIATLQNSPLAALSQHDAFGSLKSALNGFVESSDALSPRIRNTIDLVGYTLTLHNQMETAKVDAELRDLTNELKNVTNDLKKLQQDTVDDSATVKIITLVSAIYLPGSFISSMYGMNFFVFSTDTNGIHIGRDFWVFLATWLPATVGTFLIYFGILWFDSWWKHKKFEPFKRPPPPTPEGDEEEGEVQASSDKALIG